MRYAVIMAGGAGQRLWPLSRRRRPKQLLPLIQGKSLLQLAVERLDGLFDRGNILIVTNREYADEVAEVTGLPRENVVGEPEGRDTAAAIVLGAGHIARRNEGATMAVFAADHIIRPQNQFADAVRVAMEVAEQQADALVTFGIKPTWPHTGLGYIERGQRLADGVFRVRAFREKPTHPVARRYVESGKYYWNSGMFIWTLPAITRQLQSRLPDSYAKLTAALAAPDTDAALSKAYPTLEKISIDFAVMEKADNVLVVELPCEWLDVGSWPALADVSELDEDGNAVVADKTALLDSVRNVVVCEQDDHLVAMLGMDDCIVVHTPDVTLVCNRNESQRLKELVDLIRSRHGGTHL
ncbi:MAG: NTP transferase domain-containing protein [Planctomycetes bacterium]|nr:NTP transferase domain-containing protein [Planctomycetota bacterium]